LRDRGHEQFKVLNNLGDRQVERCNVFRFGEIDHHYLVIRVGEVVDIAEILFEVPESCWA
jgi:hypothetical protein